MRPQVTSPIPLEDRFSVNTLYWLSWISWVVAALITLGIVVHLIPRSMSLLAIFALGAAITTGVSLGRKLQTDTIAEVFSTGLHAALTIRRSAVSRLKRLHTESYEEGKTQCAECGKPFPCPTREILDQLGNELTAELRYRSRHSSD